MKSLEQIIEHLKSLTPEENAAGSVGAPTVLFLCRQIKGLKDRIEHLESFTHALPKPGLPEHKPRK